MKLGSSLLIFSFSNQGKMSCECVRFFHGLVVELCFNKNKNGDVRGNSL